MIERGDALGTAMSTKEAGARSGSLLSAISQTRANYWASYVCDFTCIVIFAYLGFRGTWSWPRAVVSSLFGFAVFTLVEYAIHRWLLHDPTNGLFPLHEAHHIDAEKLTAFFFPTSLLVLMPIWLLTHWLRLPHASFFLSGFSLGYFYFGVLHHVEHTTRINHLPFRWLKSRWAAHSVHHHVEGSNYGVITSFWDYVFGTAQSQVKRKRSNA